MVCFISQLQYLSSQEALASLLSWRKKINRLYVRGKGKWGMTGKHLWVFQAREIEEFGKEVTLEQNCSWKINEACVSYSTKENGLFCPSFDWTP